MMRMLYYVFCFLIFLLSGASKKPNVLLFLTDDQDLLLGGLTPMSKTVKLIANQGITFQNAFTNAPICCPSRSSLLTGMLPHNTEVYNNSYSGNCAGSKWVRNLEPYSLAPLLAKAGYVNFYSGKYLNQYGTKQAGGPTHVPDGWHWWYGLVGNSKYYDYTISVNGTPHKYTDEYLTDLMKTQATLFIERRDPTKPFFMVLATPAPHAPFTPAPRHRGRYKGVKAHRTPSFNCTPYNKHWLLQMPPTSLPTNVSRLDEIQQHRFESLLSVDELVESVLAELNARGDLDDTYVIYTTDNGFHIGQFGQPWDKRQPYETDVKVPLLIRGPGLRVKHVHTPAVQLVDLAPTVLEMAGLSTPYYMDGASFLDALLATTEPEPDWSRNILIEHYGEGDARSNDPRCRPVDDTLAECSALSWCKCQDALNNTYACVRHLSPDTDFLFCKFLDSEMFTEAYDMRTDPYQLHNVYGSIKKKTIKHYSRLLDDFLACKGEICRNL